MSPRPLRKTKGSTSIRDTAAASLLANVNALVAENRALTREIDRLKALLGRVAALAAPTGSPSPVARSSKRGRPGTSPDTSSATPGLVKRPRKKITDPAVLEKRRSALAKARQVRAERLAQSRASSKA